MLDDDSSHNLHKYSLLYTSMQYDKDEDELDSALSLLDESDSEEDDEDSSAD